ncbi:MAG: single-stranded DNA-binding protein [Propionibacteriaceae bacterium]|nr:single-stranded DNA-binding protein [Propionibacteriaceae bacterium]
MPIKTSTSMSGFVASTPMLSRAESGDARCYMKVGQEHFIRNPDGSFTQDETSFHDLVMFRRAGEKAAAQFVKGDKFVAEGYIHQYTVTDQDGVIEDREEFVARHIGHDSAATRYSVDRTPRVQQGPTMPTNSTGVASFQHARPEPATVGM